MIFSRRRATTAISAATAFTLLTGLATVPSADAAPVSTVDDVFLGVGADEAEALLNWTTYGVATEYVEFAPASAAAGEQFPADTAKRVTAERGSLTIEALRYSMSAQLTGLEENTEYVYRIGSDERGWTKTHTLTTGDFGDTWEFSVFGDPQIGASDDQAKDGDGWRAATAAAADHPGTSMFVSVGDQVDSVFDGPTQQAEYEEFFNNEEISRYRTAVHRGNHDAPSKAYGEMFDLPNTDASGLEPYNYYFERNNTLFVALDTNAVNLAGQKQFLRDTVAAHGKDNDWIVVTYHHSTYSQAFHQADPVVQDYRKQMVDVISELGVDVVLSGHDHIHTRSHLMNGNAPVDADKPTGPGDVLHPKEGEVLYLTANTSSGSKTYSFATFDNPGYTSYSDITTMAQSDERGLTAPSTAYWIQDRTPDYTQVEVTPDTMTLTTYNVADGSQVDQVTLNNSPDTGSGRDPETGSTLSSAGGLGAVLALVATLGIGAVVALFGPRIADQLGIKLPF